MPAQAQKRIIEQGDKYYKNMAYGKAIDLYKIALSKKRKKKSPELFGKLADAYRITRDFGKAEFYYEKALKYDNTRSADLIYYYAQSLMNNGKHDEALKWLGDYQKKRPTDSRVRRMMDWCMDIDRMEEQEFGFELDRVPFNSTAADFSPMFYNDGVVFSSGRPDIFAAKDERNGESYVQLYYADVNPASGAWEKVSKLKGKSSTKFHEGTAAFSPDGAEMFYTRNEVVRRYGDGKVAILKMYRAVKENGTWVELEALPFNSPNGEYSVGQPSISADGKFVYFTSDMPGGMGGKDIYVVERYGKTRWSKPFNLGDFINTEGDEMFPFVHADGTLYFSTDGHGGFGGMDIFHTKNHGGQWAQARNIGQPINSKWDDFGIILDEYKEMGYVSSNRRGGAGSDDIYQITNLNPETEMVMNKQFVSDDDRDDKEIAVNKLEYNAPVYDFDDDFNTSAKTKKKKDILTAVLIGRVLDESGSNPIANAEVVLESLITKEKEVYFTEVDGHFYFQLVQNVEYRIRYVSNDLVYDEIAISASSGDDKILNIELRKRPQALASVNAEREEEIAAALQPNATVDTFSFSKNEVIMDTFRTQKQNYARTYYNDIEENLGTLDPTPETKYQDLSFKVQIGAFRASLPPSASFLRNAEDVVEQEYSKSGYIRYVSQSSFANLSEADNYLAYVRSLGYNDAYLVPYLNDSRLEMNVQEAMEYVK